MAEERYYQYEIKDIYGDEYIIPARSIKEAKEKLFKVHGILDDEIEDWNYLDIWNK